MGATPPDAGTPRVTACQACGGDDLRSLYVVEGIPVHSVMLVASEAEARGFPRGDLELAICGGCGFVQNVRYDPAPQGYSPACEETQHFSETFNRFARWLAQDLADRHVLRGKRVLEIGCGKGDFLLLLCEVGGCSGIGIDPGVRPERISGPAADRVTFIADFYDERHTRLEADVVLCRHTLEHIGPVREFMATVRRTIGDRTDVLVLFELPAVERVLKEGAFWDVYYEHASYFSLGSLARLFRRTGFDVISLTRAYDNQYLLLEARPAGGPTVSELAEEDDLAWLLATAEGFRRSAAEARARWRGELDRARARGERVALWGAGSKAVSFLTTLGVSDEVATVVDVNPHKHGWYLPGTGLRCEAPKTLRALRPEVVIAMNPVYLDEIGRDLAALGLVPRLLAL